MHMDKHPHVKLNYSLYFQTAVEATWLSAKTMINLHISCIKLLLFQ
jgi:hypothetical protein